MKSRYIIYIDESNNPLDFLQKKVYFIFIENNRIYWAGSILEEFDRYEKSNRKSEILLEKIKNFPVRINKGDAHIEDKFTIIEDITYRKNELSQFFELHPEVKTKLRDYKLNQIIKNE